MDLAKSILGSLIGLSILTSVVVFLYRLKYVKHSGLILWGAFSLLNLIFPFLAFSIHALFKTNLTFEASLAIFSNILILFCFGITLLLFNTFKVIKPIASGFIYLIFLSIWLIEFSNKDINKLDIFDYAFVFSKIITVGLSWLYLFDIYLKPQSPYKKVPFFWIVIGWLISATISSILNIPNITTVNFWDKITLETITAFGEIIEASLCALGFWKTKEWILSQE